MTASSQPAPAGVSESLAWPSRDCPLCPRLVEYRCALRQGNPDWHNAPVQGFGTGSARLLVVGLAPGVKGANRTGRPFTGDYAGDLLYATLTKFGFARGTYQARPDDGLELIDCMLVNAVRCVPPKNRPTGPEVNNCRPFLTAQIQAMPNLRMIVTLGQIAHNSTIRALGERIRAHPFGHGATSKVRDHTVTASYHCSRYNTNTGVLTPAMFEEIFASVREELQQSERHDSQSVPP